MPALTKTQKATAAGGAMGAAVIALAAVFVQPWEGTESVGYFDLIGIPTACVGHTGPEVVVGKRYTDAECAALFRADLEKHAALIRPCVPATTPVQSQAAFLSLAFNIGARAFCGSTVARRLNAGDLKGACDAMLMWDRAGGKVVRGLQRRRAAERALCLKGALR